MKSTKLASIKLLLLDVDGVLTDGGIIYQDDGSEIKQFNVKDGLGLRLLMDAEIQVGIVTGRRALALVHRCRNLGIKLIFDGITDKAAALYDILNQTGVTADECAFVGDDLPDIGLMKRVGFSAAPADAHPHVRSVADLVTKAIGGNGAVREVSEAILMAKGLWEQALKRFL